MNTSEPEWWISSKEIVTNIKALNNAWKYWPVKLTHNGKEYLIPETWLNIHINWWPVSIHGIPITSNVQKWVENIFQHNMATGWLRKVDTLNTDTTNSNNIHHPHHELYQE